MAIVTISRQSGSAGTEIAKGLAKALDYTYIDKDILEKTLVNTYGISEEHVERYDEKKPSFWDIFSSDKDKYLHFLKTAVYELARQGNCVIVGRGGQVLFKEIPGVFHVRIIAPVDVRIDRMKKQYGYDDKFAERVIRDNAHSRAGFHKFFFHVDWDSPCLYDMIINTKSVSVEAAIQMTHDTVQRLYADKQDATNRKLADLCLGQQVMTQIMYKEHIPVQFLEVVSADGVVTLRGSTMTTEDIARCEVAARNVPGVTAVSNEVYFIPNTLGMT